jgi:hypothetical protein
MSAQAGTPPPTKITTVAREEKPDGAKRKN